MHEVHVASSARAWYGSAVLDRTSPPKVIDGALCCIRCHRAMPVAALDIAIDGYQCKPCSVAAARAALPPPQLDHVRVGRGRWWLTPLLLVAAGVLCWVAPAYMLVGGVLALVVLGRIVLRRVR